MAVVVVPAVGLAAGAVADGVAEAAGAGEVPVAVGLVPVAVGVPVALGVAVGLGGMMIDGGPTFVGS